MKCKTCGIEGHDSQGNKELCLIAVVDRCQRIELQVGSWQARFEDIAYRLDVANLQMKRETAALRKETVASWTKRDDAERLNGEVREFLEYLASGKLVGCREKATELLSKTGKRNGE